MSAFLRSCLCVIVISLYLQHCHSVDCIFHDALKSGQLLDLTSLAARELEDGDENTPKNLYKYSPCRNAFKCGSDTAMAVKQEESNPQKCVVMANWDNQQTLPYFHSGLKRWTFNYSTGNECEGERFKFNVYFDCDSNAGDYKILNSGSTGNCTGYMYINSKWACPGEIHTTPGPDDNSLSGGTVFLIILAIGFLIYFVFGYVVCAILNRRDHSFGDYESNIPHIVFWMRLPALVVAGCEFTRDFCLGLCCENALMSADKMDPLVEEKRDDNINVSVDNPFVPPSVDDENDFDE